MNEKSELKRRSRWVAAVCVVAVVAAGLAWLGVPPTVAGSPEVVVYKTPTCGCCGKWVQHMRASGFDVEAVDVANTQPARERLGVPRRLGSCHTAQVGDYWVEGHVPADLIERLITEQPDDIRGIAVPGMPMGSPGMEGPNPVTYEVLAYHADGRVSVYATRKGRGSPQQGD
jgi:hypothetical protein